MSLQHLQQAFYQHLTTTCGINSAQIAWPNISFTPPASGVWYIPSFLPAPPSAAAYGRDAPNRHTGVFQVIVCAPLGQGEGAAITEAERLISLTKRGTHITYSTTTGVVRKAYRSQGYPAEEPACWQVPVRIEYWADVAN